LRSGKDAEDFANLSPMMAFSGNPLDRASGKRAQPAWLSAARGDANTRVMLLSKSQPLLTGTEGASETAELAFVDAATAAKLGEAANEVFLGLDGEIAYFARDVSNLMEPPAGLGHFREARAAAVVLPAPQVAILGQAKALLDWHWRHGYCPRCGAATAMTDGGYRRLCPACRAEHFPRLDPAVIMLVTAGDHCLLGRNKRFVGGHYSTLAGFIEPGETIEEAVAREVLEEVNVKVGRVRYFASQPWPFPSSLMIGCFAEAATHDIQVDGEEIIAARWFDRATMKRLVMGESGEIGLPRRDAIAFLLIKTWVEDG
jgi:NAD+ diphosphatase